MTQTAPIVLDESFTTDPWQHYELMRPTGNVHRVMLKLGVPAWLVTGYTIGKQVLSDSRFLRDTRVIRKIFAGHNANFTPFGNDNEQFFEAHMLNRDAPDHTRLRKLAVKAFTPGTVSRLSERIAQVSGTIVSNLPFNETIDICARLSYPLPITMISEVLGIEEGPGREEFQQWSYTLLNRVDMQSHDDYLNFLAARDAMHNRLQEIVTKKRAELTSRPPRDLFDQLILARDEEEKLSDNELVAMGFLLLVAGHETTVTLINNAIIRLATEPELLTKLQTNRALVQPFIEEILRLDSPVQFAAMRYATEPLELDGHHIDKHDLIIVSLLAANHDPSTYANPDELALEAKATHMAFGHGAHFCLGAALARSEAVIAIGDLLDHCSAIELAVDQSELQWRDSGVVRARTAVPIIIR